MINRIILIVLDSLGVGELPDAHLYGDEGSNTLVNLAKKVGGLKIPNLQKLGLGNIVHVTGVDKQIVSQGAYAKMAQKSAGKDTTTGHWELAGQIIDKPFPTYPDGFPKEVIDKFTQSIGRGILGNKVASGTEIIKEFGNEHMKTAKPIVYTSADSVFQIAAHEEIIPLEKLYEFCKIARNILKTPHGVGRVIARPFIGEPGSFQRTTNRKDFSLEPPYPTILDLLVEKGYEVCGVGKIKDIFAGRGLTKYFPTENNQDGMSKTIQELDNIAHGMIFTNLVDFDMKYGHRNDAFGYANALEEFDKKLTYLLDKLKKNDILMITADHGCDPTTCSTDHSREYVPLLIYGNKVKNGVNLGVRETFSDVAATIATLLDTEPILNGTDMSHLFLK
jgi:phosphopentomutase